MRLLVRCTHCRRNYDLTGSQPGARFRCPCGAKIEVQNARGHDAAVVSCSACGAAREAGGVACHYCGADFTLFETDRDSMCPACLTRVSDRARFCHACATRLDATPLPSATGEQNCPACDDRKLFARHVPEYRLNLAECRTCAGLWVSLSEFRTLLVNEAENQPVIRPPIASATNTAPVVYRRCAVCSERMLRDNLGGVILDVCGLHGVWFDDEELSRLLAAARSGALPQILAATERWIGSPERRREFAPLDETERRIENVPEIDDPSLFLYTLGRIVARMMR